MFPPMNRIKRFALACLALISLTPIESCFGLSDADIRDISTSELVGRIDKLVCPASSEFYFSVHSGIGLETRYMTSGSLSFSEY